MLHLFVTVQILAMRTGDRCAAMRASRGRGDRGQSTAEYALVLLGAAAIAAMLVSWATGTDRIGRLFNTVLDRVLDQVSG